MCSGAGAAALACLDLLVSLGIPRENIWVADIAGVVYAGRTEEMDDNKARYVQDDRRAHAGRPPARRRRLPRALGGEGAEARVAGADGGQGR